MNELFSKKTIHQIFLPKLIWQFVRINMNYFRFFLILDFFLLVEKNDHKSRNFDMFSQKDYALQSSSFWIIDRNDSQLQLKDFVINVGFKG